MPLTGSGQLGMLDIATELAGYGTASISMNSLYNDATQLSGHTYTYAGNWHNVRMGPGASGTFKKEIGDQFNLTGNNYSIGNWRGYDHNSLCIASGVLDLTALTSGSITCDIYTQDVNLGLALCSTGTYASGATYSVGGAATTGAYVQGEYRVYADITYSGSQACEINALTGTDYWASGPDQTRIVSSSKIPHNLYDGHGTYSPWGDWIVAQTGDTPDIAWNKPTSFRITVKGV